MRDEAVKAHCKMQIANFKMQIGGQSETVNRHGAKGAKQKRNEAF